MSSRIATERPADAGLRLPAEAPVLVVLEDHELVRDGLERQLRDAFPSVEFAYSGDSLPDALRAIQARRTPGARDADADLDASTGEPRAVACAVVDLDLGDGRAAADVVSSIAALGVPIVVVSAMGSPAVIQSCVLAGAQAFVTKRAASQEFIRAVDGVLRGETWMSQDLAGALLPGPHGEVQLSRQEQRALVLYASGLKLDSVARRMEVAPSTVKQYLDRVRDKYTAAGRVARTKSDLYRVARDEGLLT
mgnify:CR=1 FL=1